MTNAFRIGELVYLRPLEKSDAALAAKWINDPEITRTLYVYRPMSVGAEEKFIEASSSDENDYIFAIVDKSRDLHVGLTGLHKISWKNRHAMLGITIGEKTEWGKGFAHDATCLLVTFAFETLNLHRVWLEVIAFNERAIRCYERLGFRREGVSREHHFVEGRYHDMIQMGVLQSEWSSKNV